MEKISKKVFAGVAITINIMMSFIQILIICKVVPFDIIMGGTMESYEQAAVAASVSLIIQCFITVCIAVASDIMHTQKFKRFSNGVLMFFTAYFSINILLNLLGKTWFEKVVGSLMCVVNIICFIGILCNNKRGK